MNTSFATLLDGFMGRMGYTAGQLSALTKISKRTLANWREGRVSRPREWREIVRVAAALHLSEREASELLEAAGHDPIATLRASATAPSDRALLATWPDEVEAPFQAIADLPYFVGRSTLIESLRDVLLNGQHVTISSLRGLGGVGKTTLAARLAYLLRLDFPDGVLWARLDSSDTLSILATFAAAYNENVSMHQTVETRAAAVRTILAGRQALIVLDNAESSEQVRPLLPPTLGKTAVIVTTRHDLAIADTMHRFRVEPFSSEGEESLALFSYFLEDAVLAAWQTPLREIAALLGHLPLAVAIAAGQLASGQEIEPYLADLRAPEHRLDALVREDRSVRLAFTLSYRTLPEPTQRFLAALGSFGGDFSLAAAAFVSDTSETEAAQRLDELASRSLLQPSQVGRYALHPLLRLYALEQQTGSAPRQRMVRYFVDLAGSQAATPDDLFTEMGNLTTALDDALALNMESEFVAGVIATDPVWYVQGNSEQALHYLRVAETLSQQAGDEHTATRLLASVARCLWSLGQPEAAGQILEEGVEKARKLADAELLSVILLRLGVTAAYNGRGYQRAIECFQEALLHARVLDEPEQLGLILSNLANAHFEQGEWDSARAYMEEGLALLEARYEASAPIYVRLLHNLGVIYLDQGKMEQAEHALQRALSAARALHFAEMESTTLTTLGRWAHKQGKPRRAKQYLTEALALAREQQNPETLALTLCTLGTLAIHKCDWASATTYLGEAETVSDQAKIAWLQVEVALARGEMALAQAKQEVALSTFEEVMALAAETNMLEPLAVANFGMARALAMGSRAEHAFPHAREALALFQRMDHQQRHEVAAWIRQHDRSTG